MARDPDTPIALITGPTSGIGYAFAKALAASGHDLVLVSRDVVRLQGVADELESAYGASCEVLRADLTDLDDTIRVEQRLAKQPFDIVVNSAGFGMHTAFEDSDIALQ